MASFWQGDHLRGQAMNWGHSIVLGVKNVGLKFLRLSREVNQVFFFQGWPP